MYVHTKIGVERSELAKKENEGVRKSTPQFYNTHQKYVNNMNRKYILEEQLDICFEAIVYYGERKNGHRNSFNFKAHIIYNRNEIILFAFMSEQDDFAKKRLLEALSIPIKKKDLKIYKAYIGDEGNSIDLSTPEEIRFTYNAPGVVAMYLKQICFSYEDEAKGSIYRLSAVCSSTLKSPLDYLFKEDDYIAWLKESNFDRQCFDIPFSSVNYRNHTFLKTDSIDNLLDVLSFYHSTRFEYDMAIIPVQNGKVNTLIKSPQYRISPDNSKKTIGYLLSRGKTMGTSSAFLSVSKDYNNRLKSDKLLSRHISNYVRADYLDDVSKLIIYTTILEKMAGVRNGEKTHKFIKYYLAKSKINIQKIDDTIRNYKFRNELRNEKGDTISNFIQLRNYFVHHLGSEEAEKFLRESDMLFNLKLTITILILYRFGITEIKFKKDFLNLSVFDDCLTVGKLGKVKTTKCRLCRWLKRVVRNVMNVFSHHKEPASIRIKNQK